MMNRFISCMLLFPSVCLFCGCEEKTEILGNELPPYQFFLAVEDAETGADLLNPEVEGNLLDEQVYAVAFGTKYCIRNIPGKEMNYLYRSYMYWDRYYYRDGTERCILKFASPPYDTVSTIVFYWSDGTQTQVDCQPSSKGPCVYSELWVDGELFLGQLCVARK